jgi:hypothetical protein
MADILSASNCLYFDIDLKGFMQDFENGGKIIHCGISLMRLGLTLRAASQRYHKSTTLAHLTNHMDTSFHLLHKIVSDRQIYWADDRGYLPKIEYCGLGRSHSKTVST